MVFSLAPYLNTFIISQILKNRVQKGANLLFHEHEHENECINNVLTKYFKKKCGLAEWHVD